MTKTNTTAKKGSESKAEKEMRAAAKREDAARAKAAKARAEQEAAALAEQAEAEKEAARLAKKEAAKKEKKDHPAIVTQMREATVPGFGGGAPLQVKVKVHIVTITEIQKLCEAGADLNEYRNEKGIIILESGDKGTLQEMLKKIRQSIPKAAKVPSGERLAKKHARSLKALDRILSEMDRFTRNFSSISSEEVNEAVRLGREQIELGRSWEKDEQAAKDAQ